ncbi:uncharacterized protein JN550_008657 [Neoarthrinium moseri]|uniref:uncharacterized protein n=1 Tax=Neoarthrinium moseri TaxID=1658444 RepID=UPI001FDB2FEE|nr:uncharacterized protein JN550_008657 [Neoarthrinium moseri]KAI1864837.1 hypothetical protein JN550_008657 [Neoarthrinium moseri]
MGRPRILFLDAYDSFSNNVVSLLTTLLEADVDILHIDSPLLDPASPDFHDKFRQELQCYDAVVCGPGPGSPTLDADVGLIRHIWDLEDEHLLPVLGICLGFQSLAISCGASIRKIPGGGLHGMIRDIDFRSREIAGSSGNIFAGVTPFKATLYHSLCADIGQDSISEAEWSERRWAGLPELPDIVPLAWVEEGRNGASERILMGMKHSSKPFWGLQYHPESICSQSLGHQVISNWFREALLWSKQRGRVTKSRIPDCIPGSTKPSLLSQVQASRDAERAVVFEETLPDEFNLTEYGTNATYASKVIQLPSHVEVPDIVELLQNGGREHIVLDSASAHANRIGLDVRGRYSILALDVADSLRLEYQAGAAHVNALLPACAMNKGHSNKDVKLGKHYTVWHLLADFMDRRKLDMPNAESPFLGGFMGYITYEMGLECIEVKINSPRGHERPDLCFAWITKSIVVDHLEGTLRIQYLHTSVSEADEWLNSTADTLQNSAIWADGLRVNDSKLKGARHFTPPITPTGPSEPASIVTPEAGEYESKVRQCQDFIAAGDSYELCLTDQTSITRSASLLEAHGVIPTNSWAPMSATKSPSSWALYRTLRARQPAPFGSYLRLGGATLISSSPERFLEYGRAGLCSMRPMKGTVRKSDAVATLRQAEHILHIPKEEAENLMIVDLVRHDLHSVCGPGNVRVPQLMKVEEYASVFQMISVVEGQLPASTKGGGGDGGGGGRYTGLDVLAASLPPGSMTGAPKKRSCEILQELEGGRHRERSLYSGVVGYTDVTGRGDWSVTIRSLFRWDDETVRHADGAGETEVWRIGAGGAVTALSTPEGERDEMFTKLKGPLGVFGGRS